MQLSLAKTFRDLFEDTPSINSQTPWERDWKTFSSLHVALPENRDEKFCSLFLRMSSIFEAGVYFQENKGVWRQALSFNRGEIKNPQQDLYTFTGLSTSLHRVEKTESPAWKELFAHFFKNNTEHIVVYRIQLGPDAFILLADHLPDPWMKPLMGEVLERVMRGIP